MVTEHSTALVRRAVEEIWNGGDLALADELFAPTYVNHGGLIPDLVCGPEAIKVGVALYRRAFPAFHITVEALVAQGAMVELAWAARGSPPAAPPGGARGSPQGTLRGTTRSRLAAGQIAESWTSWDRGAVLRALGVVPLETGAASPLAPCEHEAGHATCLPDPDRADQAAPGGAGAAERAGTCTRGGPGHGGGRGC